MTAEFDDSRRGALRAFCDTIVPSIQHEPDAHGFWARSASAIGVDQGVEELISEIPDETVKGGLLQLIDVLASQGIANMPSQLSREQTLKNMTLASPDAAAGIQALTGMTIFLTYGMPDPTSGRNPNWDVFGYSGPTVEPRQVPKPIEPIVPDEGSTYEADVCVVGSGSGGSVIAAQLAQRGLKVLVLEAGGYFNESDFTQLELPAYQEMYWRGGPTPTADGNISLMAGTTLGGGTVVNWTNCLRTRDWVREQWAREHGLEGLDSADFDRHLDAVIERIGASDEFSDLNGPQQRMREGAEALGWSFGTIVRNTDPDTYAPESAGFLGFGDPSGSKRSADKTWLLDAKEHDADFMVRCHADRVISENGRAAGVEVTYTGDDGAQQVKFTVRAPQVVVACGSLESPALLLRSGIGGPAVGNYLRLHPAGAVFADYGEDQQGWWGAPQTGLVDEFADTGEGYGFLIEATQYAPGLGASAIPWTGGARHKELIENFRNGGSFIALTRDRGHGRVEIDGSGDPVPFYEITDELDLKNLRHGLEVMIRLHHAAGARQIYSLARGLPGWRVGDDLEAFIEKAQKMPMRGGFQRLFSAHQMGTCRMGTDPETSVAGPFGELHDTSGVWIGDGSAFPTSTGTNPMVSIMALAHRTAEAIGDAAGARGEPVAAAQTR